MALEGRKIWVDAELVPWEQATVHVLAQSIQRGTLVFDVMPAYWSQGRARVFGLREHLERFLGSARLAGMRVRFDLEALLRAVGAVLAANPGTEIVKLSAYHAGVSFDALPMSRTPSVAVAAFSIGDLAGGRPRGSVLAPARLQVAESIKMPARVFSPQMKIAAGYTHAALAKQGARDAGFDDVLFLDEHGRVAESSTQSFFLVDRGVVRTAPTETVLAGITRAAVIELVHDEGIPLKEEPIEREALGRCDEAFLTGTSTNVWAIGRIDARELPPPVPGLVTARIEDRFARMLAGDDPLFSPRWMQEPPRS